MHENILGFPYHFDGTCTTAGSIVYLTPYALTFRAACIWSLAVDGGTVTIRSGATGQGTATVTTNGAQSGTLYSGTAPFLCNGTSTDSLYIPANGTIIIGANADHTPTQLSGAVYFAVDE